MSGEEIIGAVINLGSVTNDPSKIDAALLFEQDVAYVTRGHAELMSLWTKRREWNVLAEAPAIYVIVDGVRYKSADSIRGKTLLRPPEEKPTPVRRKLP